MDQALYMKHISEDIRRRVIDEIEETSFTDSLRPLLKAKMKSVKAKSDYELSCKLIRYALGRGYDMEEIRNCLGELYRRKKWLRMISVNSLHRGYSIVCNPPYLFIFWNECL